MSTEGQVQELCSRPTPVRTRPACFRNERLFQSGHGWPNLEGSMAQIDLSHADIYIKDGYTKAGAINQPGGYPIGATTIVVDGFTTVLANAPRSRSPAT
jgi:hypothetical protein